MPIDLSSTIREAIEQKISQLEDDLARANMQWDRYDNNGLFKEREEVGKDIQLIETRLKELKDFLSK